MRKEEIKTKIEKKARELGFDLIGFVDAKLKNEYFLTYEKWLKKEMNAGMEWMNKAAARKNIEEVLPGAKTVICLGMNYYHAQPPLKKGEGRIARYAFGRDYHKIIKKKLKELEKFINVCSPSARTLSYVDTGAILERAYAEQAGLGFIGKNSCLITKEFGSWIFLGEIITDLELTPKESQNGFLEPKNESKSLPGQIFVHPPFKAEPLTGCGSCRKCIDACPTDAIIAPGVIDAKKCISYLTIESKKPIPKSLAKIIKKHRRLFGCDICQEVCPHNCRAKQTTHQELLSPKIAGDAINLKKLLSIKSDEEFLRHFAGSPIMRASRAHLHHIAKIHTTKS